MDDASLSAPPATLLRESDHYPTYYVDRSPLLTSTSGTHSLRSSVRPGYTQTDVTHPVLGWGGANVGLQHLGRIPNCSEVPDTCFLCVQSRKIEHFFLNNFGHNEKPDKMP